MGWVDTLLERRILFVGGKGGVGKTTTAAALGLLAARRGKRVLIASTDPAHSLGDAFDRPIGARETALAPGLTGLEIDPEAEADDHIASVKRDMRSLVRPALYGEIDRQMDLAREAPGAAEAALLERVAHLMEDALDRFDLVVFDTAPTGHTLRLLTLPDVMAAWTDGLIQNRRRSAHLSHVLKGMGGRIPKADDLGHLQQDRVLDDGPLAHIQERLLDRRRRFERMRAKLLDAGQSGFVLVLIPERLPLRESLKARELLGRFGIEVAGVVVNRVLPEAAEGSFLATRRAVEAGYLDEIDESFAATPRLRLALRPTDIVGTNALGTIADELALG